MAATGYRQSVTMASLFSHSSDNLPENELLISRIRAYWNENIHDLEMATHPAGSTEFFQELDDYRFEKLNYLPALVDFLGYREKKLLEVGCGLGTDLIHFAYGGANVTGIDLSDVSIDLARQNFAHNQLPAELQVMDGEALAYNDNSFDVVYCHGVLGYTANPQKMVCEIYRVLKPGGEAIMMVYNKYSWLNALSKVMKVDLEHEDAPVLKKYSIAEFRKLLNPFTQTQIIPERFPVKTRLHHGLKGTIFNDVFVGTYNALPRAMTRPTGWHLMAFAKKAVPNSLEISS